MKPHQRAIKLAKKVNRLLRRQEHSFRIEKITSRIWKKPRPISLRTTESKQILINDILRRFN